MGALGDCSRDREDLMHAGNSRPFVIAGIYLSAGYLSYGQSSLELCSAAKMVAE